MSDRILILDDEQSVLDILKEHLEQEGYVCDVTPSPTRALELLKDGDFALLVTDLRMPEMSGIDVVREVRKYDAYLGIVVVTALIEVTNAIQAMRLGADDYVLKPFDLAEISMSVKKALEKRKLVAENRRYQRELEARMADTERDLERTNVYLEKMLDSAVDAIITTNDEGGVTFANRGAQQMLGYSESEWTGLKLWDLLVGGREEYDYLRRVSGVDAPLQNYESEFLRKDGDSIPVSISLSIVQTPEHDSPSVLAICKDITEQKRLEMELKEMTIRESLTGLYNQRYFYDRLIAEVERAKRQTYPLTLLFIDVDNFKSYNDSHDHLAGDAVLEEIGQVIRECTRQHVDLGFRYGGDEFTVILPEAPEAQARQIAERIRATFEAKRFDLLTLSIGLMAYDDKYSERAFVQFADSMMYEAKRAGGNRVCVYDISKYAAS